MASGILSKITVIDMTEGVAGPYAASLLGDMGANVIKVERREGDWSRTVGTHRHGDVGSTHFIALNRSKRDLGLDAGSEEGRGVLERLVARADVVLSNYRADVMPKLGFDYARCRQLNPTIVYCTITGFGREGPYALFPASDTIMQAISGVMNMVGEAHGAPLRVGFPLIDMAAANYAVQSVLLALYGRISGRGGAEIDISLMAAALGLMHASFTDYLVDGKLPQRSGNQNASLAPAGAYETADGRFITVAVLRDSHWAKFCAAMDLAHLEQDERFRTNDVRVQNRAALDRIIVPMLHAQSSAYWIERLRAADILCGPINSFADIAADEALAARLPLIDAGLRDIPAIMGTPIRFDGEYFAAKHPPPAKGQHTVEILGELGYGAAEIDALLRSGAAFSAGAR